MSRAWEKRDTRLLALLVLAFVASRLLWLAFAPASASYWEESYRWLAAHEILTGATRPLLDYQADHYQGGSLFMILLAVPFLWLGGESVFSLKLAALLLSTTTLAVLFVMGRSYFGRGVAVLAGLAYLAGPPLVAFWGLVVMGFHPESALLSLLQIAAFLGLLTGASRRPAGWLAFGLACGAGFSFTYVTAISAAACALTWLLLERWPRSRELAFAALGVAVGLGPWLAYNGAHEFAGLVRIAEVFGARAAPDLGRVQSLGERLADLFVRVPLFGVFDPSENALSPGGRVVVAVAALVPAGLALFAALVRAAGLLRARLRKEDRPVDELSRRELVFVVYAFLFLLAYLCSRLTLDPTPAAITYRLFPQLVVLLLLPIAASAERMLAAGGRTRRSALAACISGLTATATASYALATRPPDPGAELSLTQGYTVLGRLLHRKFVVLSEAVAEARPVANAFSRELVLGGIGWEAQTRYEASGERQRLLDGIATLPRAERIAVLSGLLWGTDDRIRVLSQRANPSPRDVEDLERMRELARTIEPMLTALKAEQKPGA